uniref:Uncharacterized protein n=1 Tax=Anguilla anguilla TaxID=7936 RepID=A0A0E9TD16_ANGAN
MDAATGITSPAGSETSVGPSQGKTVAVSAMVTTVPNHDVGQWKSRDLCCANFEWK